MDGNKYIVVSTAVTDRIYKRGGLSYKEYLGGAGIYALCGIRLWTQNVTIVTGIGEDFFQIHGEWIRANKINTNGFIIKDPHTAVSEVKYFDNGERIETPLYGLEHYRTLEATPEELEPHVRDAAGVYIFKEAFTDYWEKIITLKKRYGFSILWEVNADSAVPEQADKVKTIAEQCEAFSINQSEAYRLFGTRSLNVVGRKLGEWKVPMILLRVGANGAFIIQHNEVIEIPSVRGVSVADPTGGGNSSSAAALYALCERNAPFECGYMGSISAMACIHQFGPPHFSEELFDRAREELDRGKIQYYRGSA